MRLISAIFLFSLAMVLFPVSVSLIQPSIRVSKPMKRPISVVLSERLRRRKPGRDLSTQDLMKLFEMRALVYHAMDSRKKMRRDLQRLASMKPTHRLGRLAPPQVRDAFDDVRQAVNGAIRVDMAAQALPGELRINARVRRDATQIGKALYVYTRLEEGDWVQHTGEIAAVSLEEGGQLLTYYAELVAQAALS